MNILVDVRLFTRGRNSGIEEYTRLLLDNLFARDRKNRYTLFYNGLRKAPLPGELGVRENVSLIEGDIPNKLFDASARFFNVPKIDARIPADIVLSPHFNILPLRDHSKHVVIFHDISFLHFPEFFPMRKRLWHWFQNYRGQARNARAVVAVSDFTRYDLISTLGLKEDQVRTIYSGVNPFYRVLPEKDKAMRQFRDIHGLNGPFLLFVGVIEPRKNVPAILRAFEALKDEHRDLKLVLVGEKGWLCGEIFKEARRSRWASDIVFWGGATYETLRFLYNLARVFVYPSFFEGFGFPPLEAQACGTPVVVSNRASLPEVVGKSGILVDPWKVSELVDAVNSLLQDERLRALYRKRGLENVKRFDWQNTAKQFLSLFNSISNG